MNKAIYFIDGYRVFGAKEDESGVTVLSFDKGADLSDIRPNFHRGETLARFFSEPPRNQISEAEFQRRLRLALSQIESDWLPPTTGRTTDDVLGPVRSYFVERKTEQVYPF